MDGRLVAYAQLIGCSRYLCILLLDCNDVNDDICMCILHTLAAYHSCRACIACTLLLEHHPLVHRGSGSDVDGVSHAILGNEM